MLTNLRSYSKQNYTKFQNKIIYLRHKIIEKPKYFLVLLLARFRVVRFLHSILSGLFWTNPDTTNPNSDSLFNDLDTSEIVNLLKEDGIVEGIMLPQTILNDVLQYVNSQDCFVDGRTDMGFKISEKDEVNKIYDQYFYVARYFNVSTSCPAISKLANDSKLREISIKYIGRQAKYTGASLYWTFPLKGNSEPYEFSNFHYDLEDYNSLRFCFYLNNVTPESGPHVCIRGSHKRKPILSVLNYFSRIYPQKKLMEFYGSEQFMNLTGKAGFGFIEDVFCFHRAAIPKSQPRLLLQLHFATNSYVDRQYHDERVSHTMKSLKQL